MLINFLKWCLWIPLYFLRVVPRPKVGEVWAFVDKNERGNPWFNSTRIIGYLITDVRRGWVRYQTIDMKSGHTYGDKQLPMFDLCAFHRRIG